MAEKEHLAVELRETRILKKSYEVKATELLSELLELKGQFQDAQKEMVGHTAIRLTLEDRVDTLRRRNEELDEQNRVTTLDFDTLGCKHEALKTLFE